MDLVVGPVAKLFYQPPSLTSLLGLLETAFQPPWPYTLLERSHPPSQPTIYWLPSTRPTYNILVTIYQTNLQYTGYHLPDQPTLYWLPSTRPTYNILVTIYQTNLQYTGYHLPDQPTIY